MKTLTMGQTSKMYSFMHPSIKSKISIHYDNITEKELIQYLRIFTIFRNLCAHNERLFSFQTRFEIPDTVLHKKLGIPQKGTQYLYGKHDVFALLIAFPTELVKHHALQIMLAVGNNISFASCPFI